LTVRVRGKVFVGNHGRIEIGDRVRMDGITVPVELIAWAGAKLSIGAGTNLNYGAAISAHQDVSIGANCLIGNYVNIMDSDYHDLYDRDAPGESASVVLEDEVWLGTRVTVLKGVRIGRRSVISAGSVVTRDIPPNCVAFGVPARVVKEL
jgi:maltose O-acetyltransferase